MSTDQDYCDKCHGGLAMEVYKLGSWVFCSVECYNKECADRKIPPVLPLKNHLRKHEAHNIMELSLGVENYPEGTYGSTNGFTLDNTRKVITDAECEVIAIVDGKHAEVIKELLEWAVENYPYKEES